MTERPIEAHLILLRDTLISDGLKEVFTYCQRYKLAITKQELRELLELAIEYMKKDPEMNIEGLKT